MTTSSDECSSTVRLNIGGKKFCTSVDTLTLREPNSMLAAMFSGRHTVCKESEKGYVFIDRDGKHFRHILNWLRDGVAPIPSLSDLERVELLREADYYQLLGLVAMVKEVILNEKDGEQKDTDLTRTDIIKCVQYTNAIDGRVRLKGVNLSGVDLSNLDLSRVDFSRACLKNVNFSDLSYARLEGATFCNAKLNGVNLEHASLDGADFRKTSLVGVQYGANIHKALR